MKSDWLAASNLERTQQAISAINTLSIHAKIALAKIPDPFPEEEVRLARRHLFEFISQLQPLIDDVERDNDVVLLGVDPRLGELARKFLSAKRSRPRKSGSAEVSLEKLRQFVNSDTEEDLQELIRQLHTLRALLEQNVHTDVEQILGEK